MNAAVIWLLILVVLAVLAPLLTDWLRRRDFRRQVSGKQPMRKAPKEASANFDPPRKRNPELESQKELARMKSRQNSLGPK